MHVEIPLDSIFTDAKEYILFSGYKARYGEVMAYMLMIQAGYPIPLHRHDILKLTDEHGISIAHVLVSKGVRIPSHKTDILALTTPQGVSVKLFQDQILGKKGEPKPSLDDGNQSA